MINTDDHTPAHVHVFGGGHEMVIEFEEDVRIRNNWGFNRREQAIAKLIVIDNQEYLMLEWRRIHG
ncbi:MAG: DUF4160 domain-containing protein [Acidobacteria bacterium]|nr:DUF4160 domain-containing protein [Acidobacteriota bacterium]